MREFLCFVFNFWRTKISSYKFWNNIPFILIFFSYKKRKKNAKIVILFHVQKERKKKTIILTTHLYSNVWFLSAFVTYLNSNTSIIFIQKKKKYKIQNTKLLLPKNIKRVILSHVQKGKKKTVILTTHVYSNIWFISVFFIYLYSNTSIMFIKKYKITS